MLAKQNVNPSKLLPSQACSHQQLHILVNVCLSVQLGWGWTRHYFSMSTQGEESTWQPCQGTFELRSDYYPALRKMKTPAIQAVSVGPSHAPAPPSCPSAYTSSALTNSCCGQTWHMTSSSQTELVTQRKSTDPIGILCNFFWFIIVPQGQNGTKCSCRPAEQSQGQLGTVAEELPMARKHSAASSPINLNRSIRLFALSIRKYSIKPSGTS